MFGEKLLMGHLLNYLNFSVSHNTVADSPSSNVLFLFFSAFSSRNSSTGHIPWVDGATTSRLCCRTLLVLGREFFIHSGMPPLLHTGFCPTLPLPSLFIVASILQVSVVSVLVLSPGGGGVFSLTSLCPSPSMWTITTFLTAAMFTHLAHLPRQKWYFKLECIFSLTCF